jgi:hypothetical protein
MSRKGSERLGPQTEPFGQPRSSLSQHAATRV